MKAHITRLLIGLTLLAGLNRAVAQGSAFTYQGRLNDSGAVASGNYDFTFTIFFTNTGGSPGVGPITNSAVAVSSNGLFTTTLDFGGSPNGVPVWLEIGVRTNGGGAFATLSPRQPLLPTPYAMFANTASNLAGTLPVAKLPGVVVTNGANSVNLIGVFSGNGSGLTNANAATLGGLSSSNFWQLSGNSGANPANGAFLGTTDSLPLELKVNGARALRIEPTADAPNVIGGAGINYIAPGVEGATIAGGGSIATYGAGYSNRVESFHGTIGGGLGNWIQASAIESTIAGGNQNSIQSGGSRSFIGGGLFNTIYGNRDVIGGGNANTNSGFASTIGGGNLNAIQLNDNSATIAGGTGNTIQSNAAYATIGGGVANTIQTNAYASVISGGYFNTIQPNANYATIPGGNNNTAGNYAFAAGNNAQAKDTGAFVWADSQNASFSSTASNQFLIRATGGVGINTNNPGANALAVVGNTRITGLLRSGSETGTSEAPVPAGLVVRAVNSTDDTSNKVVAVSLAFPSTGTNLLSLVRDGTPGGWRINYPTNSSQLTFAFMGVDSTGAQKNFYTNLVGAVVPGSFQVYANSQNIEYFHGIIGQPFADGQHHTEITLFRAGGDFYWAGTLISTFNQ